MTTSNEHNNAPAVPQGRPFGHFRAEPFGWTDCAATDDGAIALYEHPMTNPWRDAVIEQLESWHICVPAIHDNSPRLAIKALVNIETKAALDPAVSSEAAALVAGQHNNAPAVPQGYEIHEIPADYSGLVWLEGQVRAVARRAQAATGPQGWTDADSDAARLALELECLLMDTKDLSVVSKWWGSANDALELHRQRLAATPAPAPAQEVVLTDEERADMACAVAAICTGTSSRTVAATAIEWTERALRAKGQP